jgi:prepilin-type N-terminal cleavage/methylation domain-containing protein
VAQRGERGFSLVEVMVATGIVATTLMTLAQLFAVAVRANIDSRTTTYTAVLAEQKLEELRALVWGFDTLGVQVSDTFTNTAVDPPAPDGGTGLTPSPASALQRDTDGYVDYQDQFGRTDGGGSNRPAGAVYTRRWSITPLPTDPANTLVLQVLVIRPAGRRSANSGAVARLPAEARLITVKTRRAP